MIYILQTVEYVENIRVNVQLPEDLRLLLCYDLDLITRRKKVRKLSFNFYESFGKCWSLYRLYGAYIFAAYENSCPNHH